MWEWINRPAVTIPHPTHPIRDGMDPEEEDNEVRSPAPKKMGDPMEIPLKKMEVTRCF